MKYTDPIVLPNHIGKYLTEAGFSSTEIIILKRVLNGEAFTLRELATRTGKSTGVLDQATKKLIQKKILTKKSINGTPKYTMESSDVIMRWVKIDMKEKWEGLQRKKNDFESFISSIGQGQDHPLIEHYEGVEGLMKAYDQLLGAGDELLQYFPYTSRTDEENPLKRYRENYINQRRKIGMFSRVITHDNAHGRKYHSRDPFEFRKSVLVPEKEYSISFDKAIAGDTIVCFDRDNNRACLIRYPELAKAERYSFEVLWSLMSERERQMELSKETKSASNETITAIASKKTFANLLSKLSSPMKDLMKICGLVPRTFVRETGSILVDLEVYSKDRPALVYDISRPFAMRNINMSKLIFFAIPPEEIMIEIQFEAHSYEEQSYVMDELQRIAGVISVIPKKKRKDKTPSPETDMVGAPA